MTKRSEMAHRRAEVQAKMLIRVANRTFTTNNSGIDKLAKTAINKKIGDVPHDPELDHD